MTRPRLRRDRGRIERPRLPAQNRPRRRRVARERRLRRQPAPPKFSPFECAARRRRRERRRRRSPPRDVASRRSSERTISPTFGSANPSAPKTSRPRRRLPHRSRASRGRFTRTIDDADPVVGDSAPSFLSKHFPTRGEFERATPSYAANPAIASTSDRGDPRRLNRSDPHCALCARRLPSHLAFHRRQHDLGAKHRTNLAAAATEVARRAGAFRGDDSVVDRRRLERAENTVARHVAAGKDPWVCIDALAMRVGASEAGAGAAA